MNMLRSSQPRHGRAARLLHGVAAGAVGTSLLNAVTYADMALRGRPSSSVPEDDVEVLTQRVGITLSDERKEGLSALLGFVTGFVGGAALSLARPPARQVPWPVAATLTGIAVMAATDLSSTALGTTDPRSWDAASWVSDLLPHLAYGAGTVLTFDALDR
jgi:hypothetical protein